jgi:drug/metabolite transporter (DMT)-like permease
MESIAFARRLAQRSAMSPPATPHAPPQYRPGLAILCRCAATVLFTIMWALAKLASERGANTVEILFYRGLFAAPVVILWTMIGPGLQAVKTRRPGVHLQRTVIGMVSMFFTFYAITLLPLAEASTLSFTAPIFSTLLSTLLLGERVGIYRIAATLLGFLGVVIVMLPGFSGHHLPLEGLVVGVISAVGIACVTVTIRQISDTESATAIVFWFTLGTLATTMVLMPWFGQWHHWQVIALLGGTGAIGAVAQLLMTAALRFAPVAVVVPFDYTQLIWATLAGFLLWGTMPHLSTWLGSALIIAAGMVTIYREHRHRIFRAATPPAAA